MRRGLRILACVVTLTCVILCLPSCKIKPAKYIDSPVSAIVSDKEHVPSVTSFITVPSGKSFILIPMISPEEYNITFKYGKYSDTENDPGVYNKYEVGEKVSMYLESAYSKSGNLLYMHLVFKG